MYTSNYDITKREDDPFVFNVRVYAAADYYAIPILAKLACEKVKNICWLPFPRVTFIQAINAAYTDTPSTDSALRPALIALCIQHTRQLANRASFVDLVKQNAEFAADIAFAQSKFQTK
jgi:hypothetical protein